MAKHFNGEGHTLGDMTVMEIDQIHIHDPCLLGDLIFFRNEPQGQTHYETCLINITGPQVSIFPLDFKDIFKQKNYEGMKIKYLGKSYCKTSLQVGMDM